MTDSIINFTKIRYKNFVSTGNHFTEIDVESGISTLVIGSNGTGKSTILDAICYGCYGKPYRDSTKPGLINSINQKDMVVEVEFTKSDDHYKIVRGEKPKIFEIYKNGHLIDVNARSIEYQEKIESDILKMSFRTFKRVSVLGKAEYIPFMKLTPSERRSIVEEVLDIGVFSDMANRAKEIYKSLDNEKNTVLHEIENAKSKYTLTKSYINDIESRDSTERSELLKRQESLRSSIALNKMELVKAQSSLEILQNKINEYKNGHPATILDRIQTQIKTKKDRLGEELEQIANIQDNGLNCITCGKPRDAGDVKENIERFKKNVDIIAQEIQSLQKKEKNVIKNIPLYQKLLDDIEDLKSNSIAVYRSNLATDTALLNSVEVSVEKLNKATGIEKYRQDLELYAKDGKIAVNKKKYIEEEMRYYSLIIEMLKDKGIKSKVIEQYIPFFNQTINQYLSEFSFYVDFQLDEQFNETILSRYRDNFKFGNFSEGQKQRIDMSLMLAWREVGRKKASASTNLLILDEIFDNSLDDEGVSDLMQILRRIKSDTALFVISHKGDILLDKFDKIIHFKMKSNFSVKEVLT